MDLEKRGSSSSEESDQQSTKRSYECTFCKRGFTNAQALGGHMNIHRKDRAKAKILSTTRPSMSSEQGKYYPVVEARRACFEAPGHSPIQYGCYASDHFVGAASLRMNDELWGANLRLGVGPAEDLMKMRCMRKEEEIDLELRLGHHP